MLSSHPGINRRTLRSIKAFLNHEHHKVRALYLSNEGGIAADCRRARRPDLELHIVELRRPKANHSGAVIREEQAVGGDEPQVAGGYNGSHGNVFIISGPHEHMNRTFANINFKARK